MIVIGELLSLISLVIFLTHDVCRADSSLYTRLETGRSEVADRSAGYGTITDIDRSIPVSQNRTRKYSESVGRSYVASAVAR